MEKVLHTWIAKKRNELVAVVWYEQLSDFLSLKTEEPF
jgi:hypothetical protein